MREHLTPDIPPEWKIETIGSLATTLSAGGTPSRANPAFWNGPHPFVMIEDVTGCGLYLESAQGRISDEGLEASSAWLVPAGAVLVSMYATIGATAVTRIVAATNQAIAAIIPRDGVLPEFLALSIRHYRDALSARNVQSTQKNINKGILESFEIPLPPLDEQRKIAMVLGKVQAAMTVEDGLVRVAWELKQAALRQLFTRGLRGESQKQTDLGPVPESWDVAKLEDCCSVLSSPMAYADLLSRNNITAPDAVECMGVKVSDMNLDGNEVSFMVANLRNKIAITEARHRTIPADTIVFPKRGAAIATNKKRMTTTWTALDPNLIGVRAGDRLLPWFLFQWFQQFDLRTITEPGPTPQLNKKNLTPLLLPIPPEAEQREIAALLATLDTKIAHHEAKQELLRELFRTLLHDLLAARRRVTALDLSGLFTNVETTGVAAP